MRSLFLFLLLLNVLYALWQWQIGGWRMPLLGEGSRQEAFVGEVAGGVSPQLDVAPEVVAPASTGAVRDEPSSALCVVLGTFASKVEVDQLQQRLLALDISAQLLGRESVAATDYWLVMPVSGGNQGALARLSALQEQGVDSFVITRGRLAGSLSLGVFSQRDYAVARQAQLGSEGYEVRVEAVEKVQEQYQLQVPPASRRLLDPAMLARLRADFPAMQHRYQACTDVAKGSKIP